MLNRKGQNFAEYSILIAIVIGAAVAMQVYVKRGLQGRVADAVDYSVGGAPVNGVNLNFTTKQYEPYYMQKAQDVGANKTYQEAIGARGLTNRTAMNERDIIYTGASDNATWNGFNMR